MIALFTILTITFVIGLEVMNYFAESIELIEKLLPAVTWICASLGGIATVFILIRIGGELNKVLSKNKDKDKEE